MGDVRKIFETWCFGGVEFIAIPNGSNVQVLDEVGNNYGGWASVENFRDSQRGRISTMARTMGATEPTPVTPLGRAIISVRGV